MGVIISAVAVVTKSIKNKKDKKKAEKIRQSYGPQHSAPFDRSQSQQRQDKLQDGQDGLRDQHLASVPPPSIAAVVRDPQTREEVPAVNAALVQAERSVGVAAPIPFGTAA